MMKKINTIKKKKENINFVDLKEVIEKIAKKRDLDPSLLLEKIKIALTRAYEKEINPENELIIIQDLDSFRLSLWEEVEVVEKVNNKNLQIVLKEALAFDKNVNLHDKIKRPVYLSSFSYFAILKVSQLIKHFINIFESEKIYSRFLQKKNTILSGRIENIDHRYFSVDVDNAFAFIPKEEQIPLERIKHGQIIKFYVLDVFKNNPYGQIKGSRICNEFLNELLSLEIPEIGSGIIEIKKTVREPGVRAKVAVLCHDETINPIGSCIGRGGSRISAISNALNGEKIDIFLWNEDKTKFIINACSPSKVVNITFIEENRIQIIVLNAQYPVAIGKNGSAVRLLSKMTSLEVDIKTLEDTHQKMNQILLNGNLSYQDLEKLEIDSEILKKCVSEE